MLRGTFTVYTKYVFAFFLFFTLEPVRNRQTDGQTNEQTKQLLQPIELRSNNGHKIMRWSNSAHNYQNTSCVV